MPGRIPLARRASLVVVALTIACSAGCRMLSREPDMCRPRNAYGPSLPYALERVFGDMTFSKPVQLLPFPPEPGAWIVAQHVGVVEVVREGARRVWLDMSDRVDIGQQWGFQDLALHPRFPEDPRVFVAYIADNHTSVVASLRASADGKHVDPASEVVLLKEAQPSPWHPLASVEFGPDGYLYVSWGEGSIRKSDDPELLGGKMLRIDVDRTDGDKPYAVPADNPYLKTEFRPETFAIGFRNPWRFSFDRETGEIWLGDVGDRSFEEVNRVVAGGDYGYPLWEGTTCLRDDGCGDDEYLAPVVTHSHNEICSVTGGYVYRGKLLPELRGRFVYGDACSGTVWATAKDETGKVVGRPIARGARTVAAFAEDPDGELYVLESRDFATDNVKVQDGFMAFRLVPAPPTAFVQRVKNRLKLWLGVDGGEETLADAGCVQGGDYKAEPTGMIGYSINLSAWADGAETHLFASSGVGGPIYGDQDALERPRKAVMMRTFAIGGRPIETQLLVGLPDRTWIGFDYEWDADGRDARPLTQSKTKQLPDGTTWTFPGPEGCARCHHTQIGSLRALRLSQLAGRVGGREQLDTLVERDFIAWREGERRPVTPMPRLDDDSIPVADRARAYLEVNCSSCHQPGGLAGEASMDLRRTTVLSATRACDRTPIATFPGHEDAKLIVPGKPEQSLISIRMKMTDTAAMPPQRHKVDPLGTKIVDAWIASLDSCAERNR